MSAADAKTPTATLSIPNAEPIQLPLVEGSEGERAIDISTLRAKTGLVTLDQGYMNTGACKSAITFIDGDKGILRYRGYPIEELAEKSSFLEVAYLLMFGELPSEGALRLFVDDVAHHTLVSEDIKHIFDGFPRKAHPMGVMASTVAALSTYYQDDLGDPDETFQLHSVRLLAKFPTILSYAYKRSVGRPYVYPRNDLDYCSNFLRMMFALPVEEYRVDKDFSDVLNLLLILHADHEQNCSTSTVRMVRSSQANIYASVTAGICALWGPLHGGANQEVLEMLEQIKADGGNTKKYIELAKKKDSGFRLMGFGHRVYKNFDPRAKIIKAACDKLLSKMRITDPLLQIATELEQAALSDSYFIERKLYPNVDFYSGIIYKTMGFPVQMFTALFALGRLPGWIAQARELSADPGNKIGRPRQIYTGATERHYVPISQRPE